MILIENLTALLPPHAGKIVGIANHYAGSRHYVLVACEHGLFKLWDDGTEYPRAVETAEWKSP